MPTDVDLPNVVATKSFLAQTAALTNSVIFTPTVAGLFRVSAYIEAASGNNSQVNAILQWTDDHVAHTGGDGAIGTVNANGTWQISGNFAIRAFRAAANQAISVSTTLTPPCTYDLYVVIEQLA